jgi:hypothetical protein
MAVGAPGCRWSLPTGSARCCPTARPFLSRLSSRREAPAPRAARRRRAALPQRRSGARARSSRRRGVGSGARAHGGGAVGLGTQAGDEILVNVAEQTFDSKVR